MSLKNSRARPLWIVAEFKNPPVSLDDLEHEMPGPDTPSEEFDPTWTRTVLAETLQRMEADCKDPGRRPTAQSTFGEMFRIRLL